MTPIKKQTSISPSPLFSNPKPSASKLYYAYKNLFQMPTFIEPEFNKPSPEGEDIIKVLIKLSEKMITLEKKKYIKKELIILTVSMIILISIIYFCYALLTNKYGYSFIYMRFNSYMDLLDIMGWISLLYFLLLIVTFLISNYKIFLKKRKTTLLSILLIPIWFLIFLHYNSYAIGPFVGLNVPRHYLRMSFSYFVCLILFLIPTYYFRFKYYSHPKNNDELELENSTLSLRTE